MSELVVGTAPATFTLVLGVDKQCEPWAVPLSPRPGTILRGLLPRTILWHVVIPLRFTNYPTILYPRSVTIWLVSEFITIITLRQSWYP